MKKFVHFHRYSKSQINNGDLGKKDKDDTILKKVNYIFSIKQKENPSKIKGIDFIVTIFKHRIA